MSNSSLHQSINFSSDINNINDEYDYIVFSVYYKHGENDIKVCKSFYLLFKEVLKTIFDFQCEYFFLKDSEEDPDEYIDENSKKLLIKYEPVFMKYKKFFEERRNESCVEVCYSILMNEIAFNCENNSEFETIFLEDVMFINKFLKKNCETWSIRNIYKIKKNSYTTF
jgi:hypothetical protein